MLRVGNESARYLNVCLHFLFHVRLDLSHGWKALTKAITYTLLNGVGLRGRFLASIVFPRYPINHPFSKGRVE